MDGLLNRITIDPAVCHGKPCVRGLRYPVEMLLDLLSSGMTIDEVLADYEDLEREDPARRPRLRGAAGPDPPAPAGVAVKFLLDIPRAPGCPVRKTVRSFI